MSAGIFIIWVMINENDAIIAPAINGIRQLRIHQAPPITGIITAEI